MFVLKSGHGVDMLSLFFPIWSKEWPDSLNASPSLVTILSLSKDISPIPTANLASHSFCSSGVSAFNFALSAMAMANAYSGLSTTTWKLSPRYISNFIGVSGMDSSTHTCNASTTVCLHLAAILVEFTKSPVITPFIIDFKFDNY